jgi:hypothetical protein
MTVVTYPLSPSRVADVSYGDLGANKLKGSNTTAPDNLTQYIGRVLANKVQFDLGCFFSFDLNIPDDSKINSVKFNAYSLGANGINFSISGGFIKPMRPTWTGGSEGVAWQDSGGFLPWDVESKIPWPEWNSGADTDLTVYQGEAAGFTNFSAAVETTSGNTWTVGDGQSPDNLVPTTFSAQLEDYLDEYESLRGDRVADSIPVCLVLFRPHVNIVNDSYQLLGTETYGGAPTLTVDYTRRYPLVTITAPPDDTTVSEGAGVTFTATAVDGLDVDISSGVKWQLQSPHYSGLLHTGASFTTDQLPVGDPEMRAQASWEPTWLPGVTSYGYGYKSVTVVRNWGVDGHGSSDLIVSGDSRLDRLSSGRATSARLVSGNGRIV